MTEGTVKARIHARLRQKLATNSQQQAVKIWTDTVLSAVYTSVAPVVV